MIHHITWQTGLIILCLSVPAFWLLIEILCDRIRKEPPSKPAFDERNWSINYMTDFKRWTER